jgi:hypothetical protein
MSTVNKSRSPYFDDYNRDKGFHEILYTPAKAVQVRELNQIQSMFNEQIQRFGDHVFEDGSVVIPGETNYDLELKYVRVSINNYSNVVNQLGSTNINLVGTSGITANVKLFTVPESPDVSTFYVEYINSSTGGDQAVFADSETLNVFAGNTQITTASVITTGLGSKFTMESGVYYIKGKFVLVPLETIILDKYNSAPSKVVCIEYKETIVTENEDTTLFDNAQGTPNFTAPGAHRLKIDTKLAVFDVADEDSIGDNFVQIFKIVEGQVQETYRGPNYSVLGDVIAQRTYEESGDYTVKSFNIGFSDHQSVFNTVDTTKFAIQLDPGIAYVRGYRVETSSKTNIKADKARDTGIINNSSISAALGYYIEVNNLTALPSVSTLQPVSLKNIGGTEIGTARVRFIAEPIAGTYRLYLFDVKDVTGLRTTTFISSVATIDSNTTVTFTCDVIDPVIKEASFNSLVFPMNIDFVKTLKVNSGQSDTSYSSVKQVIGTTDTSGIITISSNTNEVFVAQDSRYAFGSYTDNNTFLNVSSNYTLAGAPTGSVITINLGIGNASRPVRLNLQIAKEEVIQKIKTTIQIPVTGSLSAGILSLGKADVYKIISVVDNASNDITSLFTLVENKTQSFYDVSYITTTSTVSNPITVTFDYFSHSSGDYFGPDSYVDVTYENIPSENGLRLSDLLDFRPRINDAGTGFTGTGASTGNIPTPFTVVRTDLEHYLKRIDKLFVDSRGVFGISKGVPALDPFAPSNPSDAMVLYTLYVPPYTFNISDVQAERVNNRRYTMKDIGNIESRLSNVEYYVTLNLLEQEAESIQVADPLTGLNRFKNGFFTDQFIDHGTADFAWPGYHVAISDEDAELRPEFSLNAIDLEYNSFESSGIVVNDNIATLPFTEVSYVRQNQRSTTLNVNPYAVYRWTGSLKLNPSMDSWIDTNYADPEVIYRVFNNGNLTQSWNSWSLNWTGASNTQSRDFSRTSAPHSVWGRGAFRRQVDTFRTTTTTRTNIDVVNDRIIDSSVIPFMRTIDVELTGKGNRPNSRLYLFFDNTDINNFVKPDGGSFGDPVYSSVDGDFNATFRIPNTEITKFRTGEKTVVATDEVDNEQQLSTSYAQSLFTSTGLRQIKRQTIVATRSVNTNTNLVRRVWNDPLAQSFLIERNGGAFVTKINAFFSTKDTNVPIVVQIREMENGFPTQNIIPGGEKLLNPSEVNVSNDGSIATVFQFDHPVYLTDGTEYCFVLSSNSNTYNAHIATMGEQDRGTGRFIVRQPYAGVLFKSQNNSTWTEDQQSDLQFEIFVASFQTGVVGTLITDNKDFNNIFLGVNPIETTNASSEVIINRKNHNYIIGTTVSVSNATGANNIGAVDLNKDHVVLEVVSPNQIKIDVGINANATGTIGGASVEISNTIQASVLNPNIPVIDLPNTSMALSVRGTTGQSIDGNETAYIVQTDYSPIDNQVVNELTAPFIITNRNDETVNLSSNRSFKLKAEMFTSNPNVSPVFDLSGASIIAPCTQVTKKDTVLADGSNNWANYRSRVNPLSAPADLVKVYLDVKTIISSNVILSIRVSNSEEEMNDAPWTVIPNITTDVPVDGNSFYEYSYEKSGLTEFVFYQVMIQLKSSSCAVFPTCKRLRVIALSDFT